MTQTKVNLPRMFMSAPELARVLGVSRRTAYRLMDEGALDVRWIGGSRRITVTSVQQYIANLPRERAV